MLVGIAAGASLLGGFLNIRAYERRRRREAEHGGGAEGDVKLLKGPAFGKPALGGDFTLINQDNKVTRHSDLHGAWALQKAREKSLPARQPPYRWLMAASDTCVVTPSCVCR